MNVLEVHNVTKAFGSQDVLTDVSFKVQKGEKIGLIGENGCGKTTLLKMITGEEAPTSGVVTRVSGSTVGYLAQHLAFPEDRTVAQEIASVFDSVNGMQAQMRVLEVEMARVKGVELAQVMKKYSQLQEAFEQAEGYACQARADAVIDGLGIREWADRSVAVLSGGEKNLVGLAKILLGKPDLLLLDEPGNHLDFKGLAWLERFLQDYDKTVVMVSHDRYLLDRVVTRIVEIEDGRATEYGGNYSGYRAEKMRQLIKRKAAYDNQQKEIQRLEEMIARFELWGGEKNARRARNKGKMLDRMDRINRPVMDRKRIDLTFSSGGRSGKIALELKDYTRRMAGLTLFESVAFLLCSGERAGLIGPNGCGKSTLFKDIVAEGAWENRAMRIGPSIRVGYYAQEHETLNMERTIVEEVCLAGNMNREQAFVVLSKFLFRRSDLDKSVEALSGGEKSRVQLAKLMVSGANLLLLDEPTNHLDIPSREQVEEALEQFEGTLLVISHDRYFLDKIAGRIVLVEDHKLINHEGNFSDFWAEKQTTGKGVEGVERDSRAMGIETRIDALEDEKLRLEQAMASAFERRDFKRGEQNSRRLRQIEQQIEALYEAL